MARSAIKTGKRSVKEKTNVKSVKTNVSLKLVEANLRKAVDNGDSRYAHQIRMTLQRFRRMQRRIINLTLQKIPIPRNLHGLYTELHYDLAKYC